MRNHRDDENDDNDEKFAKGGTETNEHIFSEHLIPWDCLELGKTILYIPGDLFSGPGMLDGPEIVERGQQQNHLERDRLSNLIWCVLRDHRSVEKLLERSHRNGTKSLGMNLDAFIVLRMEGILKSIDVHVSPIYHEEISTCQEEQRSSL
ncbi:hypothetical protein HZH68_005178 [Vespula germanica]|uniref:Uncharacterized protein n=1 Tax=Vespula germanica TaxID=30212 RepID=A0A834KJ82_VESGE|nr:hypothetical protein HZH68_005178 [Vespula germanica]